jgi:hypothetical protein
MKCEKCGNEIYTPTEEDESYKIIEEHIGEDVTIFYICSECWANELLDEYNEIKSSALCLNFSPFQLERMEKIRKLIKKLGYTLG